MNFSDQEKDNEQIVDLLYQLGITYLEKRDYDNSIAKFKKIIDLGEANAKVYLNLSKAYILKEQFDEEAQKIFEKSLQFEPENPVLNVILSQLYLTAGREDAHALHIYQNAIKHHPQNADEISAKLIKVSFQQGNIDVARDLMQQFIDTPAKISSFLPLYIVNEWKHQGFDRVAQYLRHAIKTEENLSFYRWFVVNFLQAEKQSLEPFVLSHDDWNLCNNYLDSINAFDHLLDIYLYPAIERLLLKYSKRLNDPASNKIEEYEVFLAEDALSNIWGKALNKKNLSHNYSIPQQGGIWKKLKFWRVTGNEIEIDAASEKEQLDNIHHIHHQAETLMVIRLIGTTTDDVTEVMSKSVSSVSAPEKTYVGGFKSSDGFLLFWKDVNSAINMVANFIQDHSMKEHFNADNNCKFQIIIHQLSKKGKNKEISIVNDLQTVLSIFQLEREMFFQDDHLGQWKSDSNYQLFVTSSLKEILKGNSQFSLEPVSLITQHPTSEQSLQIYELIWDDSLTKIKRSEIQEIGSFRLLRELHSNQVFSSYKAIDSFLDRLVIIKMLKPDFKIDNAQHSMSELFLQEAKFLGKLSHPNIALVYDIGNEQDFCFFAREYVEGVPLAVQRSINKKINVQRTLTICSNIAQTLKYLHNQNIFHGRLQPNNIFLLDNNDVKIADFQIASFAIPLKTYQTTSLKYLTYFAPEQIENKTFNSLTDIFSLGVMMYEMLTDHNPFYDDDRNKIFKNVLNKTPKPPTAYNSDLPKELDQLVLKAMNKSPKKRYKNIDELEKELIEIIGKLGN
jgi:tetratricopeptide (TPR) repeat protein/tRNA A-37 threonylcarbamoyl transferase component Bud32